MFLFEVNKDVKIKTRLLHTNVCNQPGRVCQNECKPIIDAVTSKS